MGWGSGFGGRVLSGQRWSSAPFYGMDPAGDYAIHLLGTGKIGKCPGAVA